MAKNATPPATANVSKPVCPLCGKPRRIADSPFCSSLCADIDLGRWLGGSYIVATQNPGEKTAEE